MLRRRPAVVAHTEQYASDHSALRAVPAFVRQGIGLFLSSCSCSSCSRTTRRNALQMAVGGQTQFIYLPLTLADRLGYFKDEGLTVNISDLRGGSEALAALMGGSVDMVTGFYEHTIRARAQGKRSGDGRAVRPLSRSGSHGRQAAYRSGAFDQGSGRKAGRCDSARFVDRSTGEIHPAAEQSGSPGDTGRDGRHFDDAGGSPAGSRLGGRDRRSAGIKTRARWDRKAFSTTRGPKRGRSKSLAARGRRAAFTRLQNSSSSIRQIVQSIVNAGVRALRYLKQHSAEEVAAAMPESFWGGDRDQYIASLRR